MARYKSQFKVKGDLGDMNMYELDGHKYVRETTNLTKERIMTDPKFKRTRENMMEFGGAGKVAKALRVGLAAVVKRYADSRLGSRLSARFKKMVKQAAGIRGERPVEVLTYRHHIEGMPLHRSINLDSVLSLQYDLLPNANRNGALLTLVNLDPDLDLVIPAGASHFKILLQVVGLCDHVFDPSVENYVATNPDVNSARALDVSAPLPLVPGATTIALSATLPSAPVMGLSDALVVLIGVEFYQIVSGNYYILSSGNAMDIVKVF